MATAPSQQPELPRTRHKISRLSEHRHREAVWGMLCVAPAVLGFLLWQLGPILGSFYIALPDWRIAGDPNWIGLDNFHRILAADRLFRTSLGVTAYYSLGSVPLRLLAAFTLAVLLNQRVRGLPVFRTIFLSALDRPADRQQRPVDLAVQS